MAYDNSAAHSRGLGPSQWMIHLERIWEGRHRAPALLISGVLVAAIAAVDWWTKPYVSLGFLYLFPIMLAAGFLPRWAVALAAILCTALTEAFSSLDPSHSLIRMVFVTLALMGCGLFVSELLRNRRLSLEAQERLRVLVETSPAAIVTVDERGFIELTNRAAIDLLAPRDGNLTGHPIAAFLPELHQALRREEGPQFRAAMQCQGRRDTGEPFLADVWFSTYREGTSPKLAAIVADVTEESTSHQPADAASEDHSGRKMLSSRELDVLRLVFEGLANKEIASRLEMSESSVKNTLQQLFAKTDVRTRSQLVRVALERYRDVL